MSESMFAALQDYLKRHFPRATLSTLNLLSSGWESDIYVFTVTYEGDEKAHNHILRLFLGADGAAKVGREYNGLSLLQRWYPSAKVLRCETDPQVLGHAFIIMEKIEGQSLWGVMSSADPVLEARLLDQFGQLLARLHQLDWQSFADYAGYQTNPHALLNQWLVQLRQLYAKFEVDGFLRVADWLDAHKKDIVVRPVIVHLDFHANNVLLDPNDRMVVIDWSQLAVADYRQDLSWTLMIMGDHGKPGWREAILAAYTQAIGHPIEHLDYFNVISSAKLLASTVISLKVGPEALGLRPQTADTRKEQALYLRTLSKRLEEITGLRVPEVDASLAQINAGS
jgi:aminoglycoside phosphotransferase (APT) family kinase protein